MMLYLVRAKAMSVRDAERIAESINDENPRYIHDKIIDKFMTKLRNIKTK